MEAVQLNEYLVREGEPLANVLELNLFSDAEERPSSYYEEFRENRHWMKIEAMYYDRIAPRIEKVVNQSEKTLDEDDVDAIHGVWYDGGDAYSRVEAAIRFLPGVYDEQIEAIEELLGFEN